MKNITLALKSHYAGQTTTIATCWRCQRRDGQVFGFTDHDTDLEVESEVYEASSGYTATAIASDASLAVDNLDVEGALKSDRITEADLLAGLWDYAEIRIFEVNWADISMGELKQRKGRIGNVTTGKVRFTAELRGLMQNLQQQVGRLYGPACSVDLGDEHCKIDLEALRVSGALTEKNDNRVVFDSSRTEDDGYFDGGLLTWTSGNNTGLSMEVKRYVVVTGLIELVLPMSYAVEIGDTYTMTPGCDKAFPTCQVKYNNVINFRGFPDVPGPARLISGT